jgi:hypothetical protein
MLVAQLPKQRLTSDSISAVHADAGLWWQRKPEMCLESLKRGELLFFNDFSLVDPQSAAVGFSFSL